MNVDQVAQLARLKLTGEEAQRMELELAAVLDFAREMHQADTRDVEPMTGALALLETLRCDENQPSLTREQVLEMATAQKDGYISVPKAFE